MGGRVREISSTTHPRAAIPFEWLAKTGGTVARMRCGNCTNLEDLPPVRGATAKEVVTKKFRRRGWFTDGRHARKNLCPTCSATPKKDEPMNSKPPALKVVEPGAAVPPVPSNDQRAMIRRLLDEHFDDAAGAYLDGFSDQRIGESVGIAWAAVKGIREAAYGPIRSDPQLDVVFRDVATLAEFIADLRKESEDVARTMAVARQRQDALAAKYADVEQRLERVRADAKEVKARLRA